MIIPKIFHRIWIGSKVPDHLLRYGDSWMKNHPGWEMRFWTDENIPPSRYPELIKKCKYWSNRANIYRYEIVLKYGGVYIDMDFECYKSIVPLIEKLDAFGVYQLDDPVTYAAVCNGIFGATPGHPFVKALVDEAPKFFNAEERFNMGPPYFTDMVRRYPKVKVLLKPYFFPYLWNELEHRNRRFPYTYATHHWNSLSFKGNETEENKKN